MHLDGEEVQALTQILETSKVQTFTEQALNQQYAFDEAFAFVCRLTEKIGKLMLEKPDLLTDRTPEQIAAALEKEEVSARLKKQVLANGQDWTKVKVKVEVTQ